MRIFRIGAGCALGALLLTAHGASADTTQRFTYVANPGGFYTSVDEWVQPAGTALVGQLRFVPRRNSYTIWIDDRTVLDGQTVAVFVYGSRQGAFRRCLRVRTRETIRDVVPNKTTIVTILGDGAWLPDPGPGCTGHANGGTAEVKL